MVQGTLDNAVSRDTALRLLDHIQADDLHQPCPKGQIIPIPRRRVWMLFNKN